MERAAASQQQPGAHRGAEAGKAKAGEISLLLHHHTMFMHHVNVKASKKCEKKRKKVHTSPNLPLIITGTTHFHRFCIIICY